MKACKKHCVVKGSRKKTLKFLGKIPETLKLSKDSTVFGRVQGA